MKRETFYLIATNIIWVLIVLNLWLWMHNQSTVTYSNTFVYKFKPQSQTQHAEVKTASTTSFDELSYYFDDKATLVQDNASQSIEIKSKVGVSMKEDNVTVTHQILEASTTTNGRVEVMKADPISEFFAWAWKMINNFGTGLLVGIVAGHSIR